MVLDLWSIMLLCSLSSLQSFWMCGSHMYILLHIFIIIGTPSGRTTIIIVVILNFIFLPLIMLITSAIFFGILVSFYFIEMINPCCLKPLFRKERFILCKILGAFIVALEVVIVIALSCALGALMTALTIIPSYII